MTNSTTEGSFGIDKSEVDTARTVSIVFFCLAALLPVIMVICLVIFYEYRDAKKERKVFADEWNNARLDSLRNKLSTNTNRQISLISSSRLNVPTTSHNQPPDAYKKFETKKRASQSVHDIVKDGSDGVTNRTIQYFNGAYTGDDSFENVSNLSPMTSNQVNSKQGSDELFKRLIVGGSSTRGSNSSTNSFVKNAIITSQQTNYIDNHETSNFTSSHNYTDATGHVPVERRNYEDMIEGPLSPPSAFVDAKLSRKLKNTETGRNLIIQTSKKIMDSTDANTTTSSNRRYDNEFYLSRMKDPTFYRGKIDWVGSDCEESIGETRPPKPKSRALKSMEDDSENRSTFNNPDIFFKKSPKPSPIEFSQLRINQWELPTVNESGEDISFNELDYFSNTNEEEKAYKYIGRVSNISTPTTSAVDLTDQRPNVVYDSRTTTNNYKPQKQQKQQKQQKPARRNYYFPTTYLQNPIYEERDDAVYTQIGSHGNSDVRDSLRTLDYYDKLDDLSNFSSPELHRYPGMLDLNKILEADNFSDNIKSKQSDAYNSYDLRGLNEWREMRKSEVSTNKPEVIIGVDQFLGQSDILPPPPSFCDTADTELETLPVPQYQHPSSKLSSKVESRGGVIQNSTPKISGDAFTYENNDGNRWFKNLPEVRARQKFQDKSSMKGRPNSSADSFGKSSILKEEEERALKYFEDICKELGYDSLDGSDGGSGGKQRQSILKSNIEFDNTPTDRLPPSRQASDFDQPMADDFNRIITSSNFIRPTTKDHGPGGDHDGTSYGQPPMNSRKSYEHLLSPEYPYKRREEINSRLTNNRQTTEEDEGSSREMKTNGYVPSEPHESGQDKRRAWIVTRM